MTALVFLPDAQHDWRWLPVEGEAAGVVVAGLPPADERVVAVAPASAVALHWAALPSRSGAQALAAARLLLADIVAAPIGELHVALAGEGTDGDRVIGAVAAGTMQRWLDDLAEVGIDPASVVPAPLLLPRPDEGYVAADLAGDTVARGTASGFALEPGLAELMTGGVAPIPVADRMLAASIAAAAAAVPLDLRQGPFARRRRRAAIDWRLVRRLGWLALAILGVTLATDVVRIVRLENAASGAEARADALARGALPRSETVSDPARQLSERLARLRGPGRGFSATAAAVATAVRATPGAQLTGLGFDANGVLDAKVTGNREAAVNDLKRRIEQQGFTVRAGVFTAAGGRVTGEFMVSGR